MIFTSFSQIFVRWHQLLLYYHDFFSLFIFFVILSLIYLLVTFHQTIAQLTQRWSNEQERQAFKNRSAFLLIFKKEDFLDEFYFYLEFKIRGIC